MSKRVTEPEILVTGQAMEIPLDMIRVDESKNLRRFAPPAQKLKETKESIRTNGLIQSLTVRELTEEEKGDTEQRYMLIAGFQRVRILRELEGEGMVISTVPVSVRNGNSNPLHLNLAENKDRAELGPVDEASALKTLIDAGETAKDAVKHFGKGPTWGSLTLKYLELRPAIQKKINDGDIPIRVARTLPGLSVEEQDALLADLESEDGESASSKADKAKAKAGKKKTKAGKESKAGRKAKGDKAESGGISAKQAMSRIEEQVADLKANYTLNAKDEAAIELLKDVKSFLAGKLGVQALFKRFVG